jgi:CMP-N-acetylneuraminic acid synthetase
MTVVAMIPARLGSQRLAKKNLLKINEKTLVKLCAEKCLQIDVFDKVYINSESDEILKETPIGCFPYRRKEQLSNDKATSDDFIIDFVKNIECKYLFQIHSIAPLLTKNNIKNFVLNFIKSNK